MVFLLALPPVVAVAEEMAKITTSDWRIRKPSTDFKDLPSFKPQQQNGAEPGIGLIEFVCMKSNYYMLLVQPAVKLRDTEAASVRAANAPDKSPPIPLTFRNLYKSKTLLSRSIDWDADIHSTEADAALLAAIKAGGDLELTLAGRNYTISMSNLASRWGSFQLFCEKGVVKDAGHFEE
jgi:hypothetical protein